MSLAGSSTLIEEHLFTQLAVAYPALGLSGRNSNYKPQSDSEWIRSDIQEPAGVRPYVGLNQKRSTGLVQIQVFTPKGTGSKRASMICDSIIQILNSANLAGIVFTDFGITTHPAHSGWNMNIARLNYTAQD